MVAVAAICARGRQLEVHDSRFGGAILSPMVKFGNYNVGTSSDNGEVYVNGGSLVVGNDCEFNSNTANWEERSTLLIWVSRQEITANSTQHLGK